MAFHVGQEVECVYPGPWVHVVNLEKEFGPEKGERIIVNGVFSWRGEEYLNFIQWGMSFESGYAGKCFRPITKTDISIFRAMLINPPKIVESV